jgi:uncharacterized protein YkuJ
MCANLANKSKNLRTSVQKKGYAELSYFTAERIARLKVVEDKKRLRKDEIDVVT